MSHQQVIRPNLVVLGQTIWAYIGS